MTNRYSLADYIVTIKVPEDTRIDEAIRGKSFTIGGPGVAPEGKGSFLGQISVERNVNAWDTEGDRTGSWVHNKNNDKTGHCQIDIRQVSDDVIRLSQMSSVYEKIQEHVPGVTITITNSYENNSAGSNIAATCNDCYIEKQPQLILGETAQAQQWIFTCGQVFFYE